VWIVPKRIQVHAYTFSCIHFAFIHYALNYTESRRIQNLLHSQPFRSIHHKVHSDAFRWPCCDGSHRVTRRVAFTLHSVGMSHLDAFRIWCIQCHTSDVAYKTILLHSLSWALLCARYALRCTWMCLYGPECALSKHLHSAPTAFQCIITTFNALCCIYTQWGGVHSGRIIFCTQSGLVAGQHVGAAMSNGIY